MSPSARIPPDTFPPATFPPGWRLRRLPFSLRIAVAALVLSLSIGVVASLHHLVHHHEKRDDAPGLSLTDLEGSYRGVDRPARLREVLDTAHGRQYLTQADERAALERWLAGRRINEEYDGVDLGDLAPAEILERRCVTCHSRNPKDPAGARDVGTRVPLEFWDDVAKVAFARRIDPVPLDLLAQSAHAHALTLPLVAFVVGLLALATSWPRALVRGAIALGCVGLFVDLAGWWLARDDLPAVAAISGPWWVEVIVAGGILFGGALALQLVLIVADLLMPKARAEPESSLIGPSQPSKLPES